ncbi:ComF family protein [Methylophaga muralis]|uniref:DNA utilization protein GntX n=1 Tax=Methylophaga muralis TaxID=291169 RepID=A0A1E3GV93_9GAMM|nr:ComF family protein [Methylophaga muralis]ODN67963.1 DNA utilization protein GntX [Methylophaga muralis]
MMVRNFSAVVTHRLAELYSKLLPIPCFLCGDFSPHDALCKACVEDLPWLDHCCQRCALPLNESGICGQCLQHPPPQQSSLALFRYETPINHCIAAFKFHQQLVFAQLFAKLLAAKVNQRQQPLPEILIPIPLHPSRLRQRGYNQSAQLADALSQQLSIAVDKTNFIRRRNTTPQTGMSGKQRKRNVKQAFAVAKPLPYKHVALVDDVYTTGHTAAEASRCLQQNGVKTVEVWTIARAIRHY